MPALPRGEAVLSIRRAVLSRQETVKAADAEGRICGAPTVSCPPAVPIVVSGERITPDAIQAFRYYGIDTVSVVKPT
jgi:arginine/lysine/ornithine decarboxylase